MDLEIDTPATIHIVHCKSYRSLTDLPVSDFKHNNWHYWPKNQTTKEENWRIISTNNTLNDIEKDANDRTDPNRVTVRPLQLGFRPLLESSRDSLQFYEWLFLYRHQQRHPWSNPELFAWRCCNRKYRNKILNILIYQPSLIFGAAERFNFPSSSSLLPLSSFPSSSSILPYPISIALSLKYDLWSIRLFFAHLCFSIQLSKLPNSTRGLIRLVIRPQIDRSGFSLAPDEISRRR